MVLTVLRKELALHVLTLRFQVGFLVCVGLVSVVAWISTVGYDQRAVEHHAFLTEARDELQKIEVYSDLACNHKLQVQRTPRPLAVFCQGVEGRLASRFAVAHSYGHGYVENVQSGDPFARMFSGYDVVTVLQVILSFLALLFAYDAVSGEAESGTLALVLTHPGSRGRLLLGKYLGALICLALPLIFSFVAAVAVLQASAHVDLRGVDWARIGLIFALCLLYLSVFLLLGLWLSAATRESATTLLWGAVCWVVLVLLYPTVVLFAVDQLQPLPPPDSTAQAAEDLWSGFRRQTEAFLQQHGKRGPFDGFQGNSSNSSDGGMHSSYGWSRDAFSYSWQMPWNLTYHPETPAPPNPMLPAFGELDWALIVGMLASLLAVLLTYDAVSGERQQGTLRLLLTNPVPRDTVLLGKLVAALLTCGLPLLAGLLASLLILHTSGTVHLQGADWLRLLLVVVLSLVYTAVFACCGLLVSTWVRRPAVGLLTLLLVWVLSVELVPGALGILGMHLVQPVSALEVQRQSRGLSTSFAEKLDAELVQRPSPSQAPRDRQVLQTWAAALGDYQKRDQEIKDGVVDRQLRRVRFARQLTRLSPTAVFRYALEGLADTGFPQYERFVRQARAYRAHFVEFVLREDRADPDSPHVYPVKEGLSARPVDPGAVPRFAGRAGLADGLVTAAWDLLALGLTAVATFLAAYLSFLRCDVGGE
ncbi:MAG: ABC transporter permease subunit [Candidatus Latescibacterota bacterium]